ncbi:MAG TPA: 3-hydroxyacyl-ACP dehydratase FabZ family protein [Pirellulales bacterium]
MTASLADIHAAIPHRPPFLFVDEIVSQDERQIVCRKRFTGDEWFFAGHYPGEPIVPGVLLCEAAMQAGAILLGRIIVAANDKPDGDGSRHLPVVTRINDVRFKQIVRPGDMIEIEVTLRERLAEAYFFDGKVSVAGKLAARLEFACMLVTGR